MTTQGMWTPQGWVEVPVAFHVFKPASDGTRMRRSGDDLLRACAEVRNPEDVLVMTGSDSHVVDHRTLWEILGEALDARGPGELKERMIAVTNLPSREEAAAGKRDMETRAWNALMGAGNPVLGPCPGCGAYGGYLARMGAMVAVQCPGCSWRSAAHPTADGAVHAWNHWEGMRR